ncbi:hypothetical protein [Halomicrobium salinisoli]|uniref:hypothetical protein n=1 Tax=Halomicrobium salinisoli TaxID=2878391 RepID=UPI001CF0549D|nr:hypothetical protein [Halomicrobium salinisoli]
MYSRNHLLLSVAVGAGAAWLLDLPVPWWAAVAIAAVVGVGIDVDHFLVARLTTGEWAAVRRALANPRAVFVDQGALFEPGEIWPIQRLCSHVALAGPLVGGAWLVDAGLGLLLAAVLYAHLLSDLLWDVARLDVYRERHAAYAGEGRD